MSVIFAGKGHPFFTKNKPQYKNLNIGDYTYGEPSLLWWNPDTCRIGKFCSIASGVQIFGGGEHHVEWTTTYPFYALAQLFPFADKSSGFPTSKGPTVIGNDVWICHDASIMSGVTIGDGAVIGAKSLVTQDVPPYAIVGGVPARIIRFRFSEQQIADLLRIAWWDWDMAKIARNIDKLLGPDIDAFIAAALKEIGDDDRF